MARRHEQLVDPPPLDPRNTRVLEAFEDLGDIIEILLGNLRLRIGRAWIIARIEDYGRLLARYEEDSRRLEALVAPYLERRELPLHPPMLPPRNPKIRMPGEAGWARGLVPETELAAISVARLIGLLEQVHPGREPALLAPLPPSDKDYLVHAAVGMTLYEALEYGSFLRPPVQSDNTGTQHRSGVLPTVTELMVDAKISNDTFNRIRRAAGIELGVRGGATRNRKYPPEEVQKLIEAVRAGNFLDKEGIEKGWLPYTS